MKIRAELKVIEEHDFCKAELYLRFELYDAGQLVGEHTTETLKLFAGESGLYAEFELNFSDPHNFSADKLIVQPIERDPDWSRYAGLAYKAAQRYRDRLTAAYPYLGYIVIGVAMIAEFVAKRQEADDLWPAFEILVEKIKPGSFWVLDPQDEEGPRALVTLTFEDD